MDEIRTGPFEISTAYNDLWKDWQVELAKEDLRRRARMAMEKIMRDGVAYTVCLYPVTREAQWMRLTGLCVIAQWQDCEVGEACYFFSGQIREMRDGYKHYGFDLEAIFNRGACTIYIYRRIE